ncbi:helix-hairpin-helix domain-containing protein [Brevibacterium sp. JNUCC-42]|nr:helix-hairpin-helix domain-containing protein [Brevibacterium sp. JNUCC-42]
MIMELWDRYRKWIFMSGALLFVGLSFWLYPSDDSSNTPGFTPVALAEKETVAKTELQENKQAKHQQKTSTAEHKTNSGKSMIPEEKTFSNTRDPIDINSPLAADERIGESKNSFYLDVKGAVTHPGLYAFESNERVMHAIKKAGGFLAQADQKRVNLAQKLTDGMVLYVPTLQESATVHPTSTPSSFLQASSPLQANMSVTSPASSSSAQINIKTATLEQLMNLPGIGKTRAEDIIAYREKKGFSKLEDLTRISGIGKKTFEKIKKVAICE